MTTIETHLQSLRNNATPEFTTGTRAKSVSSKAATVEKLLGRPRGASTAEMMTATTWQNHTVRAFLSGMRKKGCILVKEPRKTGEVAYRLAGERAASDQASLDSEAN